MSTLYQITNVETAHLFPILDEMLVELLSSLTDEEWNKPTIAKLWRVKDIASHLLNGNLRGLSTSRDHHFSKAPDNIHSYPSLVSYLNGLNADWVKATDRLSPQVLIALLITTGKQYTMHLQDLNAADKAIFSVAWAGQDQSPNWFHIAREYTEKFLHQQQIRDAVGKQALFTKELFHPFMETLLLGLPHTFKNTTAAEETTVAIHIDTSIGGSWYLVKQPESWQLQRETVTSPAASISLHPNVAWKLFSKGITPAEALQKVILTGDEMLARRVLNLTAVMA